MALIHFVLGNIEETRLNLLLYAPSATVAAFVILLTFHTIGLVCLCCGKRNSQPKKNFKEPKTTWGKIKALYYKYLGTDGLFGRRGKYYNWRIVIREVVEIPSQTYQAYLLSQRSPYTVFPRIYGAVIALDCILVPIILLSSRLTLVTRRNGVILLDIIVDIFLGGVLPFMLMIPPTLQYLQDPEIKMDRNWAAGTINTVRHLMVTSPFDLFITTLPLYFSHLMINTVHKNWTDGNDRLASQLTMKRLVAVKENSRSIGSLISTIWGVLLLIESIRAPTASSCNAAEYKDICTLEVHPWFNFEPGSCHCLVAQISCDENPQFQNLESQDPLVELIDYISTSDIKQRLLYFSMQYCPIKFVPESITNMKNLMILDFFMCDLETIDVSFQSWDTILHIFLQGNKMKAIPDTSRYPPQHLMSLIVTTGSEYIESIPEWIASSWSTLLYLELGMGLKEFPAEIFQLKRLTGMKLALNSEITSIPPGIESLTRLKFLVLDGCSLTSLPEDITTLGGLNVISVGKNQLETLPWSPDEVQEWNLNERKTIFLRGNPICQNPEYAHLEACSKDFGCSDSCPPFLSENLLCDLPCNTSSCNWDNGNCLRSHVVS